MNGATTRDALLGGKVWITQPAEGYRAGVDPVLLAASCPAKAGEHVLELGCGVGAASLCLAARVARLHLTGVERQPEMADLARVNAQQANLSMEVATADLADLPADLRQRSFDHVIANPPYFLRESSVESVHRAREAAMGEETPLLVWLNVAYRRLKPKGWLTLIHRPDRLPDLLSGLEGFGSIALQPLLPRIGRDAQLIVIRARKGGRAPFRIHAPVVLHAGARHLSDGEDYTPEISAVLRDGAPLPGFGAGHGPASPKNAM